MFYFCTEEVLYISKSVENGKKVKQALPVLSRQRKPSAVYKVKTAQQLLHIKKNFFALQVVNKSFQKIPLHTKRSWIFTLQLSQKDK